ncbi:hypothetical protein CTI12_AA442230 [Artemisia annua]|uniref:Uncharacterized protein n=1 Tax=Artemisia annua TaxID=35608 RepID=A0A2U1LXI0_ARTAN|nr:hypothetical protein CTI12_AA442230 [Artemisia annua]
MSSSGKRPRNPFSPKGKKKEQPPFENQDSSKRHADLQEKREAYEFINSLMDEIVKDCNMARELQKQMKELMKSINRKEALIEKIKKYFE